MSGHRATGDDLDLPRMSVGSTNAFLRAQLLCPQRGTAGQTSNKKGLPLLRDKPFKNNHLAVIVKLVAGAGFEHHRTKTIRMVQRKPDT
jgi:hypothetical protein